MSGKDKDIAGVIAPPPLIFGVPLALGLWVHATIGGLDVSETILPWLPRALTGGALAAAGAVIIVVALRGFSAADTPPEPWEETRALVTGGIYRRTRNPMYLGMALIFFGVTLIAACLLLLFLFAIAIVVIDRGVIRREEAYMERKFGAEYMAYKGATKRWI